MVASGILSDTVFPDPVHDVAAERGRFRIDENGSEGICPYGRDVCGGFRTADRSVST